MASNKEKFDKRDPFDYSNVLKNKEIWRKRISYWRKYPYKFARFVQAEEPSFELAFIQDLLLYVMANYDRVHITGPRGISKTYIALLSEKTEAVLRPYMKQAHTAPTKEQATNIIRGVNSDVDYNFPLLAQEFQPVKDSTDEFVLRGRSSDLTEIRTYAPLPTTRGGNITQMKVEESGQEGDRSNTFNHRVFQDALMPAVRTPRMVNKKRDTGVRNKIAYLTNASSKQNDNYRVYLKDALNKMTSNKIRRDDPTGFVIVCNWRVAVLSNIRTFEWAMSLKDTMSPDAWLKNMESIYLGSVENPILRDEWITKSRTVNVMEDKHCGKPNIHYSIGYDVSQEEGSTNAKCALVVNKFYELKGKNQYMIETVFAEKKDPVDEVLQAKYLKEVYNRYCPPQSLLENGTAGETYLAIDIQSFGTAVLNNLMKDLGDGNPPFTTIAIGDKAQKFANKEQEGAVPCIYPIKARGGYNDESDQFDPDSVMIDYVSSKMSNGYLRIPISTIDGVKAYKLAHKIKDDYNNYYITEMYSTIDEMIGQIQNLKKKFNGNKYTETRISKKIQRDLWSAEKYSCRIIQLLESKLGVEDSISDEWDRYYKGEIIQKKQKDQSQNYYFDKNFSTSNNNLRIISKRKGKI